MSSDTHIISNSNIITRQLVAEDQRTSVTADLFGVYFPLQLEPFIFSMASRLSEDYGGGYWLFYTLDNGGFYMAPDSDGQVPGNQPERLGGVHVGRCLRDYRLPVRV